MVLDAGRHRWPTAETGSGLSVHITKHDRIPGAPAWSCCHGLSLACGLLDASDQPVARLSCVLRCAGIRVDSIV